MLKLPVASRNYSAASPIVHTLYTNVCRAGSLAVILQPAFVHCLRVGYHVAVKKGLELFVEFEKLSVDFGANV